MRICKKLNMQVQLVPMSNNDAKNNYMLRFNIVLIMWYLELFLGLCMLVGPSTTV